MMNYIKKHRVAILFIGIVALSIIRIASGFYSGYSATPHYIMSFFSTEPMRYILMVICAVVVIMAKELTKNHKISIFIGLALLLIIGFLPIGHFVTLGALRSINSTDPKQFRDDSRILFDEYEANTKFSDYPQRAINQYTLLPRNKLPYSLLKANIGEVFILEKYILIEKFGLGGSFRGFIVFQEGADIWVNDKSVTRLEGCSYCWKIRIADGLYWYHAAPVEEENAKLDFLSE